MDIWDAVREERLDLVARLSDLSTQQWDSRSLCSEWRIRDVLGHVTASAQGAYRIGSVVGGMIRHGFNFNRWISADGRERGAQDPSTILDALRKAAGGRWSPPGAPHVSVLADVVIHGQDMYRPLGFQRQLPESHLRPVAEFMTKATGFGTKKRVAGLHLVATDMDWSYGDGPEVAGPAEALVMLMAGRLSAMADLAGAGKETLATRCT